MIGGIFIYINSHYPFEKINLDYSLRDLSLLISEDTLINHYNNYYLKYLNNLNNKLSTLTNLQNLSLDELLFNPNLIPNEAVKDILYNAGGVYNHQIYFESLSPNSNLKENSIKQKLESTYGSIENFNETFIKTANNFKSCGYIFLVCNEHNELSLLPINSQDTTVPFNLCPLMCIDLFEHAYIFDYNNRREDYIKNFIKFINWDKVNEKYVECLKYLN